MASMIVIFLTAALFQVSLSAVDYNYDSSNTTYGPSGWAKTFPQFCNGSRQSPIDIKPSEAIYDGSLGDLTFENYDNLLNGSVIRLGNSGKSYRVFFEQNKFKVSGGGLPGVFYTHNFHLHWGADNTKGSEHTIDGKKFPLELHFVNLNIKYPNVSEALKHADGAAALGILYEVGEENPELKPFLKYTANVTQKRDINVTGITQALRHLLPDDPNQFYRYDGSLTTPICQEVITWTVFKNHKTISQAQLNMLRSLKSVDDTKMLVDTFRPVQPLNSRVVKKTFTTASTTSTTKPANHAEAYHVTGTMTTIVSLVMAMVMSK